ncbi:MAG TPA: RNA-binding protein [Thermoanaerobaculia bacterium]|jgi:RNA recognition motif-containing protein|nr:RNA-binding protein [Thermoanaerobaculia bacterium]
MRLHVGNLPKQMTDAQLSDLAAPFGATSQTEVAKDRDGSSKGFGFIEYSDDAHATAAIETLNGKEVDGFTLKVSEARPRKH